MTYRVELTRAAAEQLKRLHPDVALRVRGAIELLAVDPHPPGAKSLVAEEGLRVRISDYRIVCTVEDDRLLVVVIRLGHRSSVYR